MRLAALAIALLAAGPAAAQIYDEDDLQPFADGVPPAVPVKLFDLNAGSSTTVPSLDNLSSSMRINGTNLTLVLCLKGSDATASGWVACDGTAANFAKVEVGADIITGDATPLMGGNDLAVEAQAADYYQDNSTTDYAITTEDLVVEFVIGDYGSGTKTFLSRRNTAGYDFAALGSRNLQFTIDDGPNTASIACAVSNDWTYGLFIIDRSVNSTNGAMPYCNGHRGTGANPSAVGSITSTDKPTIFATSPGTFNSSGTRIALIRIWKCASCLENTDLTEEDGIALERMQALSALTPSTYKGAHMPTTMTRNNTGMLRKYNTGTGLYTLFNTNNNWPRNEKLKNRSGYLNEWAITNVLLQASTFGTTWAKISAGDTLTSDTTTDPEGGTTADSITGEAVSEKHGFKQSVALTDGSIYTLSVYVKAGAKTWAKLSDESGTNQFAYFDISNNAVGTLGSGSSASAVDDAKYLGSFIRAQMTFTAPVNAGSDEIRVECASADSTDTYAGDGATKDCYYYGAQLEIATGTAERAVSATSLMITTSGSVSRPGDLLIIPAFGNATTTGGSVVIDYWAPTYTTTNENVYLFELDDDNDYTENLSLGFTPSGNVHKWTGVHGGSNVWAISGSTIGPNSTARTVAGWWSTAGANLYVNGAQEGTPDTTVTPMTEVVTMCIGCSTPDTNYQSNTVISRLCIYDQPGVTQCN